MAAESITFGAGIPKPVSQAVWAGDLLYISGQVAPATDTLVAGGPDIETSQLLKNLSSLLENEGLSPGDVIKANMYLVNIGDFVGVGSVYATFFGEPRPARTTIGVAALPGRQC